MANMEENLTATITQAHADGELFHKIIHGNATTAVVTENGIVPSVAKQLKDTHDEIVNGCADYLGSCLTAKSETVAVRDNALVIQSAIEQLKTDTTLLKNTTEGFKNQAQTTYNNVATAVSDGISSLQAEGSNQVSQVQAAATEQIQLATAQADRAEQATSTKVETNLSNISKETLFSKMFEEYVSGKTWYRVWPDGWIEQGGEATSGGQITVTFPKAFSDTNYTVVATSIGTNSEIYAQCIKRTSASQMTIYNYGGSSGLAKSWYACGY